MDESARERVLSSITIHVERKWPNQIQMHSGFSPKHSFSKDGQVERNDFAIVPPKIKP